MNPSAIASLVASGLLFLDCIRAEDRYRRFCIAAAFFVFSFLLAIPQVLTAHFHPQTMDLALYRIDGAFGLDPFVVSRFVYSIPALKWTIILVYDFIPLVIVVLYLVERPEKMFKAMVVAPLVAFVLYNIVPAVGPIHAFAGFPYEPTLMAVGMNPRNCFPSMHLGWALLLAWNMKSIPTKAFAWAFVALTATATIASGEHYFIDLFVAVPMCWSVNEAVKLDLFRVPSLNLANEGVASSANSSAADGD